MADGPPVLKPVPRRTFEITPASTPSTEPASPSPENANPEMLEAKLNGMSPTSRTRSILNLTSSTLFGIYSPTGYDVQRDEPSTPWGTGAQTPSRSQRQSIDGSIRPPFPEPIKSDPARARIPRRSHGFRGFVLPLVLRTLLLSTFGIAYGIIITHLHDHQGITPVRVENIDRKSWTYPVFWAVSGVVLGSLLPWFDGLWDEAFGFDGRRGPTASKTSSSTRRDTAIRERPSSRSGSQNEIGADWSPIVRSVGAFIGIAFAIRRLPWESTHQVSLTLALMNPALWYVIDRSKPGFILSAVVGIAGTLVLFSINPEMVPPPSTPSPKVTLQTDAPRDGLGFQGLVTNESIAVATWVASVLFCSSVCFGNIGRKLGLGAG